MSTLNWNLCEWYVILCPSLSSFTILPLFHFLPDVLTEWKRVRMIVIRYLCPSYLRAPPLSVNHLRLYLQFAPVWHTLYYFTILLRNLHKRYLCHVEKIDQIVKHAKKRKKTPYFGTEVLLGPCKLMCLYNLLHERKTYQLFIIKENSLHFVTSSSIVMSLKSSTLSSPFLLPSRRDGLKRTKPDKVSICVQSLSLLQEITMLSKLSNVHKSLKPPFVGVFQVGNDSTHSIWVICDIESGRPHC